MAVRLDPFQNIVGVSWATQDLLGPFWISSGELIEDQFGVHFHRRGNGVGYQCGDGSDAEMNLAIRNPDDPLWVAVCDLFTTLQASGGASASTMELQFSGHFEDEERASDPPFNPNDIDWLDGMVITVEGYGDLPALGGSELVRFFLSGTNRTRFLWTEPTTTGIDLLPLSADLSEEERYDITYPGSEEETP